MSGEVEEEIERLDEGAREGGLACCFHHCYVVAEVSLIWGKAPCKKEVDGVQKKPPFALASRLQKSCDGRRRSFRALI